MTMTLAVRSNPGEQAERQEDIRGQGEDLPRERAQTESESSPHTRKEHTMKRGHVTGNKKERKGHNDWYKAIAEENLRRVEAAWAAKQAQGK